MPIPFIFCELYNSFMPLQIVRHLRTNLPPNHPQTSSTQNSTSDMVNKTPKENQQHQSHTHIHTYTGRLLHSTDSATPAATDAMHL